MSEKDSPEGGKGPTRGKSEGEKGPTGDEGSPPVTPTEKTRVKNPIY